MSVSVPRTSRGSRPRSFVEVKKRLSEKGIKSKHDGQSSHTPSPSQTQSTQPTKADGLATTETLKTVLPRKSASKKNSHSSGEKKKGWNYVEPLPCGYYHTKASNEEDKDIENPRVPYIYKPPFRRNFRYFGYPRDLNPDLNTPPRVRSWGPLPEQIPRVEPARKAFHCKPEEGLDPYWPGRLLKNCAMLENPTLVPVMGKAVQNLGRKPIDLVKPDLEFTNCVSELYFPLTESSRKAFCRINKIVKEDMAKQVRDFTIQNPMHQKRDISERTVRKSESKTKRKSVLEPKKKRQSRFSMIDLERKTADIVYYEKANAPEIFKLLCIPDKYPGINKQLYGKPLNDVDKADIKMTSSDDDIMPRMGLNDVYEQFSVPEDLWEKLAKVRARKQHQERVKAKKDKGIDKEFKTFTQLEMRNEVLGEAKRTFLENLNRDVNTPLPPELFEDNREKYQPPHDYLGGDELPAQGPFWWKIEPEEPPTEEELFLIDHYIQTLKDTHNYTHHLPGLIYVSRHPFPVLELDWFEKGADMGPVPGSGRKRKSPKTMHDIAFQVAEMDEEHFEHKFQEALNDKAKDLVGPEIYAMYKYVKGIVSPAESQTAIHKDGEEEEEKVVRRIRVRKLKPTKEEEVDEEEMEEDKEDEENEEEDEEEQEEEDVSKVTTPTPIPEPEPEYNLEFDLENEDEFPLPDVRFSAVEISKDQIPKILDDKEGETFRKALGSLEWAEPIRKSEEEIVGSDQNSASTTDSELDLEQPEVEVGHDPTEHLQALYQEAIKAKYRNTHHFIRPDELKPPDLKDIFLENTFVDDIETLLTQNPNIPSFLQLF